MRHLITTGALVTALLTPVTLDISTDTLESKLIDIDPSLTYAQYDDFLVLRGKTIRGYQGILPLINGQLLRLKNTGSSDFSNANLEHLKNWIRRGNYVWMDITSLIGQFPVSDYYAPLYYDGKRYYPK